MGEKWAILLVTDQLYFTRARRTIIDLRGRGGWTGEILLLTDGFPINQSFIDWYSITVITRQRIDTNHLVSEIKKHPFHDSDGRELSKLFQWHKIWIFDSFFKKYDYILYLDAGLRIFDSVVPFFDQREKGTIMALDDSHPDNKKRFECQLEVSHPLIEEVDSLLSLDSRYFLNCAFLFSTDIIDLSTVETLIFLMNKYPLCKTNEMAIFNIYFTGIKKCWKPWKINLPSGKILFDWTEREGDWRRYHAVKYSRTLPFDI